MATVSDVRDILELEAPEKEAVTRESLMFGDDKKKKLKRPADSSTKKPEGMHRELWGLLYSDARDAPPIIPTDTNQGYVQMKARIGRSKVRPWKWVPFTNPARKDGTIFYHWRRVADEGKDYPFARFNKNVDVPTYSDAEYAQHLHDEAWSRPATDHMFELAKRFDLRFIVIHEYWDVDRFGKRTIEDMKERYYNISNTLTKIRAPGGQEPKVKNFDADHERRRKEQLIKLFNRTQEDIEEEEYLMTELRKIEQKKKERERKTQDLQKLITAADGNAANRNERKTTKKKFLTQQKTKEVVATETTGIKFPDFKQSGVSLRGQRMKLPAAVGQKKTKAIEQVLDELGIDPNPIPTEDTVTNFNELRQDIVLLYELKLALANCEYELQTLRHRYEQLAPGKTLDVSTATPTSVVAAPATASIALVSDATSDGDTAVAAAAAATTTTSSPSSEAGASVGGAELAVTSGGTRERKISETIDVVGVSGTTPTV